MKQYLLFLLFFVACVNPEEQKEESSKQDKGVAIKNHFAEGFEIIKYPDYKVIRIYDLNKENALIQEFQINGNDRNNELRSINNPQTIACNSTTHTSYLAKLGLVDKLIGVSWPELIMNEDVREAIDSGKVKSIGAKGEINMEIVLEMNPDLLMVYPYESLSYDRFEDVGLNLIYNTEYQERHPLAKAEWIKFYGTLFGEEMKAIEIYNKIEKEYMLYKQTADIFMDKPSVFTGSFLNGQWFAPASNSSTVQSLKDAGAEYVFEELGQNGNVQLDFEVMYESCKDADFYGTLTSDILDLKDIENQEARLSELKSIQEGSVFYCNSAESDYFGDALLEPHEILADLISIFHPEVKRGRFKYFKPVDYQE